MCPTVTDGSDFKVDTFDEKKSNVIMREEFCHNSVCHGNQPYMCVKSHKNKYGNLGNHVRALKFGMVSLTLPILTLWSIFFYAR